MQHKKVTLKDVATATGCSLGAVSVVLNNRPSTIRVSGATREKIKKVAEKVGYVANYHAQSLHLNNSFTIGLVWGEEAHSRLANGFWAKCIAGLDKACRQNGYDLLFVGSSRGKTELERAIMQARQSRLDGLIVIGGAYGVEERAPLEKLRFPVVYFNELMETRHPGVVLDDVAATRTALDFLREQGHQAIAYVSAEPATGDAYNVRLRLFRELCPEVGLKLEEVHVGTEFLYKQQPTLEEPIKGYYQFMTEWLKTNKLPTAVAFFSDHTALGGLAAMSQAEIKVPADVSVFSFDDTRAVLAVPALSVVSSELFEMGEQAVKMVIRMIGESNQIDTMQGHRQRIKARFIDRESITVAKEGN